MDYIESLISRMKADAERDGKATISSDEIVILLECYNDHMGPHKRFAEDHIEPLLYRIKADAEPEGKATISADEVVTLLQWYNDHRGLKKRFAEVHFQLLDRIARENVAIRIQKEADGTTHERTQRALEELVPKVQKKSPVDETFYLHCFSALRNGFDPLDPEKKLDPLSEEEAIAYICSLSRQSRQEIKAELKNAYFHVLLYESLRRNTDLFKGVDLFEHEKKVQPSEPPSRKDSDREKYELMLNADLMRRLGAYTYSNEDENVQIGDLVEEAIFAFLGIKPPDKPLEPFSEEWALEWMAYLDQQTEGAVKKKLQRAYKRLEETKGLPKKKAGKQLKKIIPDNWGDNKKDGPPIL